MSASIVSHRAGSERREYVTAAEPIAKALGGYRIGNGWSARCPCHDDRTPSLSLRDTVGGKVLVHCHAGCDQEVVVASLKARGLWPYYDSHLPRFTSSHRCISPTVLNPEDAKRSEIALSIWQAAKPAGGSLIETYLESRGLRPPAMYALRFNPRLKHPSGGFWPAMIALVTRGADEEPLGIHRTFLARNGVGKASASPQKMMLGPCRGGVVRLGDAGDELMVGEGIETCLAAMQETGKPAWAALSTSGLRSLALPLNVREVIVLADGDAPGEAAALDCSRRWQREGRRVRIARPPNGMDFNDLIRIRNPASNKGAQ